MKQSTFSQLVSVVIPCYNQARFLGQAIDSVLAQTCPASQIIVVDDGSVDDTVQVATGYDSVQCLSQPNRGQGAARNEGLAHAWRKASRVALGHKPETYDAIGR
jgi:glycosyltransferase involved in cell wall biosynthesis